MNEFLRRLHYLLNRRRFDRELTGDMEFHREMAAREGRSNFGNALHLREEARDAWGWVWMERLSQDLCYAVRMLRKSPGFTLAAVAMLAIGIGVNVAVFGFFDLMVLRPLNVRDPGSLLRFHRRGVTAYAFALPYPEAAFFREHSRTLSAVLAVNSTAVSVEGEGKPLAASFVTANYFHELGAASAAGRLLDASRDEAPGAEPVVVLGHGFWQRHFAADPTVASRVIHLNGKPATIVGVAAADFGGVGPGLREPAFWAPIVRHPYFSNGSRLLTDLSVESPGVQMWGRLAPGQNPKAAEEELRSLATELRRQHPTAIWEDERLPSEPGGYATSMISGNRRGTGAEQRDPVYPVFAMVGSLTLLILAVACGNLGSMLLARSVARQREIAIRVAIGAGNGRLIRQLFTESLLLAALGAAAGLGLGYVVLRSLLVATGAPAWLNAGPDWRVVAFALGAGFASAILFGLTPALQAGRQRHGAMVARQVLIAAQVAASCILMIVAGLLGRALDRATSKHLGFDYSHVVSINPDLSRYGYSAVRARAYLDGLQNRLRTLPGVQSVALSISPPLGNVTISAGIEVDKRPVSVRLNRVDPQFFETMKIPLLRGRNLAHGDVRAAVISESMARLAWPGQDALGKTFNLVEAYTVVGISGNVQSINFGDSDSVQAYFPLEAGDAPYLLARTAGPPQDLAKAAVSEAKAMDPGVFPEVELLSSAFRRKIEGAEYSTLAVGALGFVAQLLACLGIVGVVAYAVSQRTREIGIRMALGAQPVQVLSVVLRQFSRPVIAGLFVGLGAAAALSQFLRGRLYGISNLDPATYLAAIAVFLLTVTVAALLPARKALHIDPLRALRHD